MSAETAAKVLAACDFHVESAVETLMDESRTREALAQWGRADRRGRTPTRTQQAPQAPPPPQQQQQQQQQQSAAQPAPRGGAPAQRQTPSQLGLRTRPEVYRPGDPAPQPPPQPPHVFPYDVPTKFRDAEQELGAHPGLRRIQKAGDTILNANHRLMHAIGVMPPPQPTQPQLMLDESTLRARESAMREAREAAEAHTARLRAEELRIGQELKAFKAMASLRAGEGAVQDVTHMVHCAREGIKAAARNADLVVDARCKVLRADIDTWQQQFRVELRAAHSRALAALAAAEQRAEPWRHTISLARAAAQGALAPPHQPPGDAAVASAASQLHAIATRVRELSRGPDGAPAPIITVAQKAHQETKALMSAVLERLCVVTCHVVEERSLEELGEDCAAAAEPGPARAPRRAPLPATLAPPPGLPTFAQAAKAAPAVYAAAAEGGAGGRERAEAPPPVVPPTRPASPPSPPPPECPAAFPPLQARSGRAKGQAEEVRSESSSESVSSSDDPTPGAF